MTPAFHKKKEACNMRGTRNELRLDCRDKPGIKEKKKGSGSKVAWHSYPPSSEHGGAPRYGR